MKFEDEVRLYPLFIDPVGCPATVLPRISAAMSILPSAVAEGSSSHLCPPADGCRAPCKSLLIRATRSREVGRCPDWEVECSHSRVLAAVAVDQGRNWNSIMKFSSANLMSIERSVSID